MEKGFLHRRGLLFACLLAWALPATADTRDLRFSTPNGWRSAVLAESATPRKTPRPLVLVLHGHGGSAGQALGLKRLSPSPLAGWVELAEKEDLLVAAIEGAKGADDEQGWNDCRKDAVNNPRTDDVVVVRTLVKKLVAEGRADPERIYAIGMSNGGMMAFRLALQMPELAAFASVSGSMAADSLCPEAPPPHVAALIINGDADPLVPWRGGQVKFGRSSARGGVMPLPTVFSSWAAANQLDARKAQMKEMPPQFRNDMTRAKVFYFGSSPDASPVTLVEVENGGHVEPSLEHRYRSMYLRVVGLQSSAFETSDYAWAFFRNKTLKKSAP